VRDYLLPEEIEKRGSHVTGAFVIDMLLEYDDSVGSQNTSDLGVRGEGDVTHSKFTDTHSFSYWQSI